MEGNNSIKSKKFPMKRWKQVLLKIKVNANMMQMKKKM